MVDNINPFAGGCAHGIGQGSHKRIRRAMLSFGFGCEETHSRWFCCCSSWWLSSFCCFFILFVSPLPSHHCCLSYQPYTHPLWILSNKPHAYYVTVFCSALVGRPYYVLPTLPQHSKTWYTTPKCPHVLSCSVSAVSKLYSPEFTTRVWLLSPPSPRRLVLRRGLIAGA